jgi:hypothetical protein
MSYSIAGINKKVERIKQFILNEDMQVRDGDVRQAVIKFMEFKEVAGNMGNDIHYLTLHLANSFLKNKHGLTVDLSKPPGSAGLDIELEDVVAEIKTNIPHKPNDFGAAQKREIKKDLERLELASEKHKYFFVVNDRAERILKAKYVHDYPSVEVVNLLRDTTAYL